MKKEIIRPSTIEWPEDFSMVHHGMSQSLFTKWMHCKRAFVLTINGYYLPSNDEKTNFGSMCHEINDKVYNKNTFPTKTQISSYIDEFCESAKKKNPLLTHQQLEFDAAKCEVTMMKYFEFYKKDFKTKKFTDVEHKFRVRWNGIKLRGKIDAGFVSSKKKWKMEHKTKSQIPEDNILMYLMLDFQNLFYLLADSCETGTMAEGMLYNVIRNTSSKQAKNQTLKSWKQKLSDNIDADPEHFFKRWEVAYTKEDHRNFSRSLEFLKADIEHHFLFRSHYPNTVSCLKPYPCQFLQACSTNSLKSLSKKHGHIEDILFPELEGETHASEKTKKKVAKRKVAKRKIKKKTSRK